MHEASPQKCRLLAAAYHREVQERDDDGPGDAKGKDGHPACGSQFRPTILLWVQWVVKNRKGFTLPHGNRRGEFIAEGLGVGVIAKRDHELVGAGADSKGKGIHPGELVAACGDFCLRFQPGD